MKFENYRSMMERCSNCLGCKWIPFDKIKSQRFGENCPSSKYFNFHSYSARGKFQLGQVLLDGKSEITPTAAEAIFSCNACGLCDVSCKICRYNLEPLSYLISMKAYAVEKGKAYPVQEKIAEHFNEQKTMIRGSKHQERQKWAEGLKLKDLTQEQGEVMFFAGCKYSYAPAYHENVRKCVEILLHAGIDVGTLGADEACCGGRMKQMGYTDEFEKAAFDNLEKIKKAGVKTIVTPCADCYAAFKRQYAALGLSVKVVHIVEMLDELIKAGTLKFTKNIPMKVTYHDPCNLGRLGEPYVPWDGEEKKILNQIHTWEPRRPRYNGIYGIYDAPRNILANIPGVELVEMERIREYSWCCGAGGVCGEINPEFSSWTATERVEEACSTYAEAIVTACPWCKAALSGAADQNGNKVKVYDIVELVELSL
jgi:Fe-S oxidoreductase